MSQPSVPQPLALLETPNLNPPAESLTVTTEDLPTGSAVATDLPFATPEPDDNRTYARHWGINE
jgi:hypothetical protein